MDPADTKALCQVLTSQGTLLGQVLTSLRQLSSNVVLLLGQSGLSPAAQATASLTSLVAHSSPLSLSFIGPCEPYVSIPNCYSGEVGHCSSFLLQCFLFFDLQPSTYSSEAKTALWSILSGCTAQWANVVIENHASLSVNYEAFVAEPQCMFNHHVQGG